MPRKKNKWQFYKVSAVVKCTYSVDDVMAKNAKKALMMCRYEGSIPEDIQIAYSQGTAQIEFLEMKAEACRLATKEEVEDGYGPEEWID